MVLLFDKNDLPFAQKLRDERLAWLGEVGAIELSQAEPDIEGFLFGYEFPPAAAANDRTSPTSSRRRTLWANVTPRNPEPSGDTWASSANLSDGYRASTTPLILKKAMSPLLADDRGKPSPSW
jgi:hypothetical protein